MVIPAASVKRVGDCVAREPAPAGVQPARRAVSGQIRYGIGHFIKGIAGGISVIENNHSNVSRWAANELAPANVEAHA